MNILKSLQNLAQYLYHDEETSWEECGKPKSGHIFFDVKKLWKFAHQKYQYIVLMDGGTVEGEYGEVNVLIVDMDDLESEDLCPNCKTRLDRFRCSFCKIDWKADSVTRMYELVNK
jgi:hypothetical protein